jgi:zinc D-Ala-D-Ala carboxypeptidase
MKLSKHLTLAEAIRSESAKRLGISNMPTPEHLENGKIVAEKIFEPIREFIGGPVYISSFYRSKSLNSAVGGSLSSQHCRMEAMDIDMDGTDTTNKEIFDFIKGSIEFDQLIWEFGTAKNPDWVHVSYNTKGAQRKQILKASKINGKTVYTPMT